MENHPNRLPDHQFTIGITIGFGKGLVGPPRKKSSVKNRDIEKMEQKMKNPSRWSFLIYWWILLTQYEPKRINLKGVIIVATFCDRIFRKLSEISKI